MGVGSGEGGGGGQISQCALVFGTGQAPSVYQCMGVGGPSVGWPLEQI